LPVGNFLYEHGLIAWFFTSTCIEANMDELSYVGIVFTVVILGLACFMAAKLASKTAYH
jgi:hypothetical protein